MIPENIYNISQEASWNSKGEGGFLDWNSEGMGEMHFGFPKVISGGK